MTNAIYELGNTAAIVLPKVCWIGSIGISNEPLALVKFRVESDEKLYRFDVMLEGLEKPIQFLDKNLDIATAQHREILQALESYYSPIINKEVAHEGDSVPDSL